MSKIRDALTILVIGLPLSGCVTVDKDRMYANQTAPSTELKRKIVQSAIDNVYDPYSIRSAEISNVMTPIEAPGWQFVCVKANAKNRLGGYVGRRTMSLRVRNGTIVGSLDNAPGCLDPRVKYRPFPELENIQ